MSEATQVCKDCGENFILSQRDISFFLSKNLSLPKRCHNCRNTRRTANRILDLTNYVGKFIVRTKPTVHGDTGFMDYKVKLLSITPEGDILYAYPEGVFLYRKDEVHMLDKVYNDGYWRVVV